MTTRTFYTYLLIDPRNLQPFYVGKGSKNRTHDHYRNTLSGRPTSNPKLRNKINSIHEDGLFISRQIVLTTNNEAEAFAEERELIALYGRENLCNLTHGGEGVSGFVRPPDKALDELFTWSWGIRRYINPQNFKDVYLGQSIRFTD